MSHSPAWAEGLTVNEVDLTTSDGRILMRITHGGPRDVWDTRGRDTTIPGAHGQVARNRKRHRLAILAEGAIAGAGADEAAQRADFVDLEDVIAALMEPTQDPYVLSMTRADGSVMEITARPVNVMWGQSDEIPTYRELSCEWLAIGDDWTAGAS